MSDILRYYTIGAVVPDPRSLANLAERLGGGFSEGASLAVLCRRRDEKLVRLVVPGAHVSRVETGLSRRQWLEFFSTFFAASTVSFLMGAVHLWTGIVVQAILTFAAAVGLVFYHRRPRLERTLLGLGLPEKLAGEWAAAFPKGFALVLATVPADASDETQEAFLQDDALVAPLAADRRTVF